MTTILEFHFKKIKLNICNDIKLYLAYLMMDFYLLTLFDV